MSRLAPNTQKDKTALLIFDAGRAGIKNLVKDDLANKPRAHARPQAATHRLAGPTQCSMDVQDWLSIFARRQYANSEDLMCAIDRQEHGLRRAFRRTPGAHDNFTASNAPYQDSLACKYAVFLRKPLDTSRHDIAVLQAQYENPAMSSFTCLQTKTL